MSRKTRPSEATKKINFEQVLCNLSQVPLQIENEPVTLKYAAVSALMGAYPEEHGVSGVEKYGRYALAKRIFAGETEFTPGEIEKIKTFIAKQFVSLIVGPAFDMLDGNAAQPAELSLTNEEEHA